MRGKFKNGGMIMIFKFTNRSTEITSKTFFHSYTSHFLNGLTVPVPHLGTRDKKGE